LPLQNHRRLKEDVIGTYPKSVPYPVRRNFDWDLPARIRAKYEFNDGAPDLRLAPVQEIRKEYTSIMNTTSLNFLLTYTHPQGDERLRISISEMLKNYRGLDVNPGQIMITRGSIMGLYLLSQVLTEKGDIFAMENPGYSGARQTFKTAGCRILNLPVDEKGIVVEKLENHLRKEVVKAVYVTSHHQHPTTVSLTPERRMHLLQLAQTHRFAIIEDDYDYEFHYENKPFLPIASADNTGSVIYIGSFSKTLFPSLRIGYIVAPDALIDTLTRLRFIIDNNGDTGMERTLSRIIDNGTYYRHIRKSLKHYRSRKTHFCSLLDNYFREWISYKSPEGGMVVWGEFDRRITFNRLAEKCHQNGLRLAGNNCYSPAEKIPNATRLGFASMNEPEITEACKILRSAIESTVAQP